MKIVYLLRGKMTKDSVNTVTLWSHRRVPIPHSCMLTWNFLVLLEKRICILWNFRRINSDGCSHPAFWSRISRDGADQFPFFSQGAKGVCGELRVHTVPPGMPAPAHECNLHRTGEECIWCYPLLHRREKAPSSRITTLSQHVTSQLRPREAVVELTSSHTPLRRSTHPSCPAPPNKFNNIYSFTSRPVVDCVPCQPVVTISDICRHCLVTLIKHPQFWFNISSQLFKAFFFYFV